MEEKLEKIGQSSWDVDCCIGWYGGNISCQCDRRNMYKS